MSFFKNISTNVARAKQTVMAKVGQAESTSDPQFNQYEALFKEQHAKIKKLYKLLQNYQTAVKDIGVSQAGVGSTMAEQYTPNDKLYQTALQLNDQVSPDIEKLRIEMETFYKENFYLPIERYLQQYKAVEDRIAERNRRLVDMDRYNGEVKLLASKPDTVPTRLQVAKDKAESKRIEYDALNSELILDIQKLIADRSRFFDALFANLIKGQMDYFASSVTVLNTFNRNLSHVDRSAAKGFQPVITDAAVSAFRAAPANTVLDPSNSSQSFGSTHQSHANANVPPPVIRSAPPVPTHPIATALYAFQGQDASELSFQAGDRIQVSRQAGEWWEGELHGRRGLFPANYVRLG